jgi:hypothetical protein
MSGISGILVLVLDLLDVWMFGIVKIFGCCFLSVFVDLLVLCWSSCFCYLGFVRCGGI